MKNIIDTRVVISNLITNHSNEDAEVLADIVVDISKLGTDNKISAHELIDYCRAKAIDECDSIQTIYADTIAYIEYISKISVDRIRLSFDLSAEHQDICNKKDIGICGMFCDGHKKTCMMYEEDNEPGYIGTCSRFEDDELAIEVCSFEEGDPL